jgi:transcription elongation factor Elf1
MTADIITLPVIRVERDEDDYRDLMKVLDRRDFLCRNPPRCHRCETVQVQLKHMDKPAEWKCRRCKLTFNEEPAPTTKTDQGAGR